MTPPLDPDFISPTGMRVTPHPRPGAEQVEAFVRLTGLTLADLTDRAMPAQVKPPVAPQAYADTPRVVGHRFPRGGSH